MALVLQKAVGKFALLSLLRTAVCTAIVYPEQRSDLQRYRDTTRCYPDVGEWYLMFRNYYEDPDFGGVEECVRFRTFGTYSYENYTTSVEFVIGNEGSIRGQFSMTPSDCYTARDTVTYMRYDNVATSGDFHVLYTDCRSCSILRHPYAADGYGCSYWRRIDTFYEANDCCEFIYAQNCGTSPRYYFYDDSCPL